MIWQYSPGQTVRWGVKHSPLLIKVRAGFDPVRWLWGIPEGFFWQEFLINRQYEASPSGVRTPAYYGRFLTEISGWGINWYLLEDMIAPERGPW